MDNPENTGPRTWRDALLAYRDPRVITMIFLGFSAGLPFLLVFSTLSAWLRDAEVSRAAIGFFSWVGITYSIKVIWAPVIDRLPVYFITRRLGRRRSWMLIAMIGIAVGLLGLSGVDPANDLRAVAMLALLVAFSSATQDVAIDAYRIEIVEERLQGAMAATYQFGYRLALLVAGGGALLMADYTSWSSTYIALSGLMLVGVVTVLFIPEPKSAYVMPDEGANFFGWFLSAVYKPFADFFSRNGSLALLILAFVGVFRISDLLMGVMANPFYIDMGFTLTEIGVVTKFYGTLATIIGAFSGGLLVVKFGILRPLLLAAALLALTNLPFAILASLGANLWLLAGTITADNFSAGLGGAVFIAYLSSLTNRLYTATQYALFTSLMTLPGKFLGGFSGILVDGYGYTKFFILATLAGIPAICLVLLLMRSQARRLA